MKEPRNRNEGQNGEFKREKVQNSDYKRPGGTHSVAGIGGVSDIVESVIAAGAYLSFGRTRDGGATVVRVLDGPDKLTAYASSREEFLAILHSLQLEYPARSAKVTPLRPTGTERAAE